MHALRLPLLLSIAAALVTIGLKALAWRWTGSVSLLSDAGCPAVADPGAKLVALAHRHGVQVVPHSAGQVQPTVGYQTGPYGMSSAAAATPSGYAATSNGPAASSPYGAANTGYGLSGVGVNWAATRWFSISRIATESSISPSITRWRLAGAIPISLICPN